MCRTDNCSNRQLLHYPKRNAAQDRRHQPLQGGVGQMVVAIPSAMQNDKAEPRPKSELHHSRSNLAWSSRPLATRNVTGTVATSDERRWLYPLYFTTGSTCDDRPCLEKHPHIRFTEQLETSHRVQGHAGTRELYKPHPAVSRHDPLTNLGMREFATTNFVDHTLMMRSLTPLIFRHLPISSNAIYKPLGAVSIRFDQRASVHT